MEVKHAFSADESEKVWISTVGDRETSIKYNNYVATDLETIYDKATVIDKTKLTKIAKSAPSQYHKYLLLWKESYGNQLPSHLTLDHVFDLI